MPKIIIEDIKINRRKVEPSPKDKIRSSHYTNLSNINSSLTRNIKEVRENTRRDNEEKIDHNNIERLDDDDDFNGLFKDKKIKNKRIGQIQSFSGTKTKHSKFNTTLLIIFVICLLTGGTYLVGNIFQKANIIIVQKHQDIDYKNKQFTASKEQAEGDDVNPIKFEIGITSDRKMISSIVLTDTKEISEKAKGIITLYNEFGMNPQRIAAGTFIADENGKTYKIDSTVTVPGYKLDDTRNKIPGEIDANVTSFLPGDIYNGSPEKFYITMFKGTDKYEKIYGKIKTPLTGGAQGLVYVLNDTNKDDIKKIAENSIKNDLLNQAKAQIPEGYILYPNASNFSYQVDDSFFSKDPQANIEVDGLLSVILLDKQSLINKILKISLPNISSDEEKKEIALNYLNDLTFNFSDPNQVITKEMSNFSFYLDGIIDATWNPDVETLKKNLSGQDKNNAPTIFKKDPGISSAIIKIFPIWQKTIPSKLSSINVIIK